MTDLVQWNNCAGCMCKRSLLSEHTRINVESRGNVVRIATVLRFGVRVSAGGMDFSLLHIYPCSGAHPASYSSFPEVKRSDRGDNHLLLVSRLRMSGVYLCSPYMPSWSGQGKLHLDLRYKLCVASIFLFLYIKICRWWKLVDSRSYRFRKWQLYLSCTGYPRCHFDAWEYTEEYW